MKIKEALKRYVLIYEVNSFIKSKMLKANSIKIAKKYNKLFSDKNTEDFAQINKKLFEQKMENRKIENLNGDLKILWVGASKEQDYSGCIQGLRKFGNIIEYMDKNGEYLLKLQKGKIDLNIIKENDKRLLEFIKEKQDYLGKIDILIGQFWGNCLSVNCLKVIQQMKIVTIDVSMDDRLPNLWFKSKGMYPGVIGLVDGLDLVLTTSSECCKRYIYHGCPSLYWPLGSDPNIFSPSESKDIDVCFIGNCYGIRKKIVNRLEAKGINVTTYGRGWPNGPIGPMESADVFGRSKIILGIGTIAYNHDMYTLKLRDFDATMSGSLYITHRNPDLLEIFKEGDEAEYYMTTDEAARKIKYYLNNPEIAQKIGKNAYLKARKFYTWEKRFEEVFNYIMC
jgi:spore maturation protein CgeB